MIITACLSILFVNLTELPINDRDIKTFNRAQLVCTKAPYSGCVKKFIKKSKTSYQVSCGDKMKLDLDQLEKERVQAILYELRHLSPEDTIKAMEKIDITEW